MRTGESRAAQRRRFEDILAEIDAEAPNSLGFGAFCDAPALWPRAGGAIVGGAFYHCESVGAFYAETQGTEANREPEGARQTLAHVAADLAAGLSACRTPLDLQRLRRRCALAAHPDRAAPWERQQAERLMADINAAIDMALATRPRI